MPNIAVVGGGVAGLYAASRLLEMNDHPSLSVTVFDRSASHVGGRIRSGRFEHTTIDASTMIRADFGPMKYSNKHTLLRGLLKFHNIDAHEATANRNTNRHDLYPPQPSAHFLRGTVLSPAHFRASNSPYCLAPDEKGRVPAELVALAADRIIERLEFDQATANQMDEADFADLLNRMKRHEHISNREWQEIAKTTSLNGRPLNTIGFWSLLADFLSGEGLLLAQDGYGFSSVLRHCRADQALRWIVSELSPNHEFRILPQGFDLVSESLARSVESYQSCSIELGTTVQSLQWLPTANQIQLTIEADSNQQVRTFDSVVLAIPPTALSELEIIGLSRHSVRNWRELYRCSRPHGLQKTFLLYDTPWWEDSVFPGVASGHAITDLPIRQIYYYGPDSLRNIGVASPSSGLGLIVIYNDSYFSPFWRPFSARSSLSALAVSHERSTSMVSQAVRGTEASNQTVSIEATGGNALSSGHERTLRRLLCTMHQVEIPPSLAGMHCDWSESGGWHTWDTGVDVDIVKAQIVQPFEYHDHRIGLSSDSGAIRLPIFTCGEAFAWDQGWVEGALMSVEGMLVSSCGHFGTDYRVPRWYEGEVEGSGAGASSWRDYLFPELSGSKVPLS